jgi:hypothetical protein
MPLGFYYWLMANRLSYTHYYTVRSWGTPGWQQVWPQLLDDTRLILEASDILLSGPAEDDASITAPIVDERRNLLQWCC